MTHSLHRQGSEKSLCRDYVWQVYPSKGINDTNLAEKYSKVIDLVVDLGCENFGDVKTGSSLHVPVDKIRANLSDRSRLRGVFTSEDQVRTFIRRMKELDVGLSVIISGLTDRIFSACKETDVVPHSVNLALGVWGKTELLPPEEVLALTTMCGHHQISPALVKSMKEQIGKGTISAPEAARRMASLCPCGIFNQDRAVRLLADDDQSL